MKIETKFSLIVVLFTVLSLISLPRIPIKVNSDFLVLDSFIGGYVFQIPFFNYVLDLSDFRKGLDIDGGVRIVLKLDTSDLPESERPQALSSVREIIERRVNFLGVSETSILSSRAGDNYKVTVELPGVKDLESAVRLVGSTAQLQFKVLSKDIPDLKSNSQVTSIDKLFVDTDVTGKDLISSSVVFNSTTGEPSIALNFTEEGKKKFERIIQENVEKPIAIFLDENLLQMPTVSKEVASSPIVQPTITGVTLEEARQVSSLLRAGALPVPIEVSETYLVGPTLGADVIKMSVVAGLIGLALISFTLIVIYGRLGLVANICLLMYFVFMLGIFKLSVLTPFPVVLTLPGLAGFIFSIGVACDANILIFERIKEELNLGNSFSSAVKKGYDRAWATIKDSNLTTIITSVILFQFGTGFIKGFSLILVIGILVSIFTSVYISKIMVSLFIKEMRVVR